MNDQTNNQRPPKGAIKEWLKCVMPDLPEWQHEDITVEICARIEIEAKSSYRQHQKQFDLKIYGTYIERQLPDGSFERIDPTTVRIVHAKDCGSVPKTPTCKP